MVTSRISYSLHCDLTCQTKERIISVEHEISRLHMDSKHDTNMPTLYVAMATWIPKCNMYNVDSEESPKTARSPNDYEKSLSSDEENSLNESKEELDMNKSETPVINIESSNEENDNDDEEEDDLLTPKKTPNKVESASKKAQRRKDRAEREKRRQEEKQKREEEKLKERKEKEEQRRKEKEERDEQKRKEKEEKELQKRKEREEREEQKRKEREEKEQKRKQREEREEEKRKEREKKELKKKLELEEKQRLERKKEEKKQREKQLFANFFVHRKSGSNELPKPTEVKYAFMDFQVKTDMRLAPCSRRILSNDEKERLDSLLVKQDVIKLYLDELGSEFQARTSSCTWPRYDDSVVIVEEVEIGEHVKQQSQIDKIRAKFLKFHDNRRPAYFGTWRKLSKDVKARRPFGRDDNLFNYDVDSDDDWEEDDPGESLRGSDDEDKDNDPDDYEVDYDLIVPHGYLSDDENAADEEGAMSADKQHAKLKLLESEFIEERQTGDNKIVSRMLGPVWQSRDSSHENSQLDLFLRKWQMISLSDRIVPTHEESEATPQVVTPIRKQLATNLVPDFLRLVHGNTHNRVLLLHEFHTYLAGRHPNSLVSKASLGGLLKQVASWQKCPVKGPMYGKTCWFVQREVREQYDVHPGLPNTWTYTSTIDQEPPKLNTISFT